jgi:hypothetical protein
VKRLGDQTLYEILEVPVDAAPPAIEAAYDRARTLYGPGSLATYTLMTAEEAALLTSRIEEAKRTLLDPAARARYDASLAAPAAPAPAGAPPAALEGLPPVIPAVQLPAPGAASPGEPPAARPLELLQEAARTVPVVAAPIPLEREVPLGRELPSPRQAAPAAAADPCRPVELPLPEGSLWTGDALRRVREARGITVQQIAERTKVTRHHVENIEAERFSALPAPVYLRGILLAMARELRLDGLKVARAYLERAGATPAGQGAAKPR